MNLDAESFFWGMGAGALCVLTFWLIIYLKGKFMAVVDNLNAAVSSLDAVANTLSSALDQLGVALAANDDAAVQAATDKINAIVATLQGHVNKASALVAPKAAG